MEPPRSAGYAKWAFPTFSMIARYTGARIDEIAILQAEDVV